MFSSDAVANEFLALGDSDARPISPMKLQKLVYYAHGWHLALSGKPILNEPIEAWRWGPVVVSLYHEFKEFGNTPITRMAQNVAYDQAKGVVPITPTLTDESQSGDPELAKAVCNRVWNIYRKFSPSQLSSMTHADDTPWHTVVSSFPDRRVPRGIDIPNALIKDYFSKRIAGK